MIAGGEGDHAPLSFFRRKLQQAVGRAAELEGTAGLLRFAFQPDAGAVDIAVDQGSPLDFVPDSLSRRNYVFASDIWRMV